MGRRSGSISSDDSMSDRKPTHRSSRRDKADKRDKHDKRDKYDRRDKHDRRDKRDKHEDRREPASRRGDDKRHRAEDAPVAKPAAPAAPVLDPQSAQATAALVAAIERGRKQAAEREAAERLEDEKMAARIAETTRVDDADAALPTDDLAAEGSDSSSDASDDDAPAGDVGATGPTTALAADDPWAVLERDQATGAVSVGAPTAPVAAPASGGGMFDDFGAPTTSNDPPAGTSAPAQSASESAPVLAAKAAANRPIVVKVPPAEAEPKAAAADDGDDGSDDDESGGLNALLNFAKNTGAKAKAEASKAAGALSKSAASGAKANPDVLAITAGPAGDGAVTDDGAPQRAAIVDEMEDDAAVAPTAVASQLAKQKMLKEFDHSSYDYMPLKKDFFIPPADVARLTTDEVRELMKELDGAKAIGANVPPPIRTWTGIGLNDEAMSALVAGKFAAPFAVQSIAIPVLMSGRDLLAIAKTGSGKTLAYLLPLLRHAHCQPRCRAGEGPIGLILAPTHELAGQIFTLGKQLGSAMGLKVAPAYGGTSLRECIGACKGGTDVLIATPGRLFELLVANRGRVLNLRRCSSVVIDEADRMFDEGFSQHVAAFLGQIRPDRQVAMVSSTMPREVRAMARQFLSKDFVELSVGGRPCPSTNITQTVELFDALPEEASPDGIASVLKELDRKQAGSILEPKMLRLLQILGDECSGATPADDKLVMVFVSSRDSCDRLYVALSDRGYGGKVGTLYSGMDQQDREYTLARFEVRKLSILIATGVAERGIDILDLGLVINYDTPDHYEAYVNRIGRTGRAGRRGRAITFVVRGTKDEVMAGDLVRALEQSGGEVPDELRQLAKLVGEKQKNGLVKRASNYRRGFGKAKGYSFDDREKRREAREAARAMGVDGFLSDDGADNEDLDVDSDDDAVRKRRDPKIIETFEDPDTLNGNDDGRKPRNKAKAGALTLVTTTGSSNAPRTAQERVEAAMKFAQTLNAAAAEEESGEGAHLRRHQAQYDVNDFGDKIRKRLVSRKYLDEVEGETETTITVKGIYKQKRHMYPDKEPLHLEIRAKEQASITRVFRKFDEVIDDFAARMARAAGGGFTGQVQKI